MGDVGADGDGDGDGVSDTEGGVLEHAKSVGREAVGVVVDAVLDAL